MCVYMYECHAQVLYLPQIVNVVIPHVLGIVDETCTVELVNSVVEGNSATITFRGVGSEITGFTCKLDGINQPECKFTLE